MGSAWSAGPLVDERGVGDVDEDGLNVARFGVGGDGVEEEEVDGVGREVAEGFVLDAGVAGEAGGGLGESAEGRVVGVLVFDEGGGEEDGGFYFADGDGEFYGVFGAGFERGIAGEGEELEGGAEDFSGSFGFAGALGGSAVGGGFAAGEDDEVGGARGVFGSAGAFLIPPTGFFGDDSAAAEFEVVGVGGACVEGGEFLGYWFH